MFYLKNVCKYFMYLAIIVNKLLLIGLLDCNRIVSAFNLEIKSIVLCVG